MGRTINIVWHCRETGQTRTEPPAIDDDRRWEAMRPIRSMYGVALAPEGDHFDIDRMVWWEFRWPDGVARRPRRRRDWPRLPRDEGMEE